MSLLSTHCFTLTLFLFVCHVVSVVSPSLGTEEEARCVIMRFAIDVVQTVYGSCLARFIVAQIVVNVIVVCLAALIYSLCANYLQFDLKTIKGKDINWIKKSLKHRSELEDLVKMLKSKSYAMEKIGAYYVCFEDRFCIGSGSSGAKVFVGLDTDGFEVAIKRVDLKFSNFAKNEKEILNLPRSVENPNVLNYRFYFESRQYAYIVTDLQDESLNQFVLSKDRSLAELQNNGPNILRQILLGINALHDEDILHRDLKPESILVNFEGKMVLAGFGKCRRLQPGQTTHRVCYMKSDVQDLGLLFYYVLTKGKHYFGKSGFRSVSNISSGESNLTELTDPVAKDLIQWMLQHNITERPTVKQCLKHPYLMSPEVNFKFLTAVGNEMEIKTKDSNSIVVQTLKHEASLTTPWCKKVDGEMYSYFSHPCNRYADNGADLLRFIRNAVAHWPAQFEEKFDTPQAYFLQVFPTLPMIVYKIVRKYPDWCRRDTLKQFF